MRRLTLKSERLADLSSDELGAVNAAAAAVTLPLDGCFAVTTGTCDRLSLVWCLTGHYTTR